MDGKIDVKEFLEFVYSFYKTMREHEVTLVYEGDVTHQITKAFTSLTEANMEAQMEDPSTQKKVFHVMVECLQNISKHAENMDQTDDSTNKDGVGIFILSKSEESYIVTTGNVLSKEKIPPIIEMIETINSLDKEGLKNLYKQRIKEGRISSKGGAGLGFIDIAKKTGSKLYYQFLSINDEYSFFVFSTLVSRIN
ncbi:MAG TPA: SiaB family protein kinase [Salinivirgaceae bacterium]|nr:SiaB family protein kinase [Salinivirgaceae bacterium]